MTQITYGKVFPSLFDGSLYGKTDAQLLLVFMIASRDPDDCLDMTPAAIGGRLGWDIERVNAALEVLEEPDPSSRSPDCEGRRIVAIAEGRSWGWRLVNADKYRHLGSKEDKKERDRARMARKRGASKPPPQVVDSPTGSPRVAKSRQESLTVEKVAQTETETEKEKEPQAARPRARPREAVSGADPDYLKALADSGIWPIGVATSDKAAMMVARWRGAAVPLEVLEDALERIKARPKRPRSPMYLGDMVLEAWTRRQAGEADPGSDKQYAEPRPVYGTPKVLTGADL